MESEVVVPMHVVAQLHLQLAQRREPFPVDELRLQDLVGRLVHRVVVGAALLRQRPLDAERLRQAVDRGVVELRSAVGVEDLDVVQREVQRRERRLDEPRVLALACGMAHYLAVVQVDQQADVVPFRAHAHVGQVAHYVRPRGAPVEAPVDDVWHVGLVHLRGVGPEPGLGVSADQAVHLHYAADAASARDDAPPLEHGLYLPGAVAPAALLVGVHHAGGGRVRGRLRLGAGAHCVSSREVGQENH